MTLNIALTGKLEVALKTQACQQGISAHNLVRCVLMDALTSVVLSPTGVIPELPSLQLGTIGSLHRVETGVLDANTLRQYLRDGRLRYLKTSRNRKC